MKKLLLFFLLTFLIMATPIYAQDKVEGEGFASPEEAVTAYINGLINNDIDEMLSAYAVETFVEHYSLENYLDRLKSYTSTIRYLPNVSDYAIRINCETRRDEIMSTIRYQYLVMQYSDVILGDKAGYPVPFGEDKEYADAGEFIKENFAEDDSPYLSDLRFDGEMMDPGDVTELYSGEVNQANLEKTAAVLGADEVRSTLSAFHRGSETFVLCMDCARYGEKWFLYTPQGNINAILGIPFTQGGLIPLRTQTVEEILREVN